MTAARLCVVPDCIALGSHRSDCTGDNCLGCVPETVDFGMLCKGHRKRLGRDIGDLPAQYDDLALALQPTGRMSERSSGSKDVGISLNPAAVKAREHITVTLWSWARIVAEERKVTAPADDDVATVANWLGRHVDWLARQDYADEVSVQFRELVGEARSIAYPSGARRFRVPLPDRGFAKCPGKSEPCPGYLSATLRPEDDPTPSVMRCDTDATHSWTTDQWHRLGQRILDRGKKETA